MPSDFQEGDTSRTTEFEGKEPGFVHAVWTWQAASKQDLELRRNGERERHLRGSNSLWPQCLKA